MEEHQWLGLERLGHQAQEEGGTADAQAKRVGGSASGAFYLYTITKVRSNLHTPGKFEYTCMSKLNFVLPSKPFRPSSIQLLPFTNTDTWARPMKTSKIPLSHNPSSTSFTLRRVGPGCQRLQHLLPPRDEHGARRGAAVPPLARARRSLARAAAATALSCLLVPMAAAVASLLAARGGSCGGDEAVAVVALQSKSRTALASCAWSASRSSAASSSLVSLPSASRSKRSCRSCSPRRAPPISLPPLALSPIHLAHSFSSLLRID